MSNLRRASSFDRPTISSEAKARLKFKSSELRSFRFSSIEVARISRNRATTLATPVAPPLVLPNMPPLQLDNFNLQVVAKVDNQEDLRIRDRPQTQREPMSLRSRNPHVNYRVSFSFYS